MIVLVDNFDSFTFNIVHLLYELNQRVIVVQNQVDSIKTIESINPSHLILGPGPGSPKDALLAMNCIARFQFQKPILGICLGHQCIAEFYGGKVRRSKTPIHGKVSKIYHNNSLMFKGVINGFNSMRYHSLVVDNMPSDCELTAITEEGNVMGLEHKLLPIYGLQFHHESILSKYGSLILTNFLSCIDHFNNF
jgi:para-aminobenzoate synthetase component 2